MPDEKRTWLIEARKAHELTREQAEILVRERSRRKLYGQTLEHAIAARQARRGLSQPDLALLITAAGTHCSQNEVCKIETGERQRIRPEYVAVLSSILRMTRDEVTYGSPQPKIVMILGEVEGDEAIRLLQEEERQSVNGWTLDPGTIGYRVATDAHPRYEFGEILLCREASATIEECIGRRCVVEIEGRRYVGRVEPGASARVITLRPARDNNPLLIDRTPMWISPIVATYHTAQGVS